MRAVRHVDALVLDLDTRAGLFITRSSVPDPGPPVAVGTAVSDLQDLEQNQDLYSSFELLDDLDLQQDVVANP